MAGGPAIGMGGGAMGASPVGMGGMPMSGSGGELFAPRIENQMVRQQQQPFQQQFRPQQQPFQQQLFQRQQQQQQMRGLQAAMMQMMQQYSRPMMRAPMQQGLAPYNSSALNYRPPVVNNTSRVAPSVEVQQRLAAEAEAKRLAEEAANAPRNDDFGGGG
jgi:hypothetical protein